MPLITVAAHPHAEERGLLRSIADAVAKSLGLGPGDVIAMSVPVRETVANTDSVIAGSDNVAAGSWMLVSIHGSDRGSDKMRAACASAETAANEWSRRLGVDGEGVWCEWLLPQHP
ncbi:hypothetical protein [Microbacterium alcoholitolerans]|uniref:hypothetical protein n=1 Tax=unclassified Microbacterium TaxID=2609290 RepID=UPI003D186E8B